MFNESLVTQQDYDYFLRIAHKYPLAYLDEKLVYYRRHPNQLTDHKNIERIFKTVIHILEQYKHVLESENRLDEYNRRQRHNYLNLAKIYMDTGRRKEARQLIKKNIHDQPGDFENYPNLIVSYFPLQFIRILKTIF